MTGLLWDLDGTLVDSVEDIAAAADRMLRDAGLPPLGVARVRAFVGEGARRLVDRCVQAAGGEPGPAHLERFLAAYRAAPVVHTRAYPGIPALLAEVAVPQAVVTNKPEELSRAILARLGLHFPVVIGGDTLPVRKPDPAPVLHAMRLLGVEAALLVGDGPADVGAARAAGIGLLGVGWGISRPEGAGPLLEDVAALRRALAERGLLR